MKRIIDFLKEGEVLSSILISLSGVIVFSVLWFFAVPDEGKLIYQLRLFYLLGIYFFVGYPFIRLINDENPYSFIGKALDFFTITSLVLFLVIAIANIVPPFLPDDLLERYPMVNSLIGWPSMVFAVAHALLFLMGSCILADAKREYQDSLNL